MHNMPYVYQDPPVDLLDLISSDKGSVFCNRAILAIVGSGELHLMKFPDYQNK